MNFIFGRALMVKPRCKQPLFNQPKNPAKIFSIAKTTTRYLDSLSESSLFLTFFFPFLLCHSVGSFDSMFDVLVCACAKTGKSYLFWLNCFAICMHTHSHSHTLTHPATHHRDMSTGLCATASANESECGKHTQEFLKTR